MQPVKYLHAVFQSSAGPMKALYFKQLSGSCCPLGTTVHDVEHSPKAAPVVRNQAMKSMRMNIQEGQATVMR